MNAVDLVSSIEEKSSPALRVLDGNATLSDQLEIDAIVQLLLASSCRMVSSQR